MPRCESCGARVMVEVIAPYRVLEWDGREHRCPAEEALRDEADDRALHAQLDGDG